jgi:hypothetical protein
MPVEGGIDRQGGDPTSRCSSKRAHAGWLAAAAAIALLTSLSCTQLKSVPLTEVTAQQLVGDELRVTTLDGRAVTFRLEAVADSALVGVRWEVVRNRSVRVPERVRFDEIAEVERREFSVWKTVGAAAVVAGAALLSLLIALSQADLSLS